MDYPLPSKAAIYDAGENYESRFPVQAGLLAGLGGSLSIMVIVTGILLLSGNDIWTAVRLIATSVYGPDAGNGLTPILVGTILHLVTGTLLGAIFAHIMPRGPRGMFIMAGIAYGVVAWGVSTFMILPIVAPLLVATDVNISVLLIAHISYGFTLGLVGAGYGLWWELPSKMTPGR
jgi:hypothetical protein